MSANKYADSSIGDRGTLNFRRSRENNELTHMPEPDVLIQEQTVGSIYRLHEDAREYPRFPWRSLADISGPMCPEDLVIVAARTGGGKSLFLQNLFDALIVGGRAGLYIGLEQDPEILRIKWAALRADVPARLVLAAGDARGSSVHTEAMEKVQREIRWQQSADVRARAHFATLRKINRAGLRQWTLWAIKQNCHFIIVDHIDRIQHGNGTNSFHEMSETVRLAKELAAEHRVVMIVASQVGRPGDALEQFMPPSLHSLRGGGTKEEEADTVLGIYRPLRQNVTDKQLTLVRRGLLDRDKVFESGAIGIALLKHRLDGPAAGRVVRLAVRHQRILERDDSALSLSPDTSA